jgi:RNA-splicing ligase RtcB
MPVWQELAGGQGVRQGSARLPGVQKRIDAVMAKQSDLVEIVHMLKQLLCVKRQCFVTPERTGML